MKLGKKKLAKLQQERNKLLNSTTDKIGFNIYKLLGFEAALEIIGYKFVKDMIEEIK